MNFRILFFILFLSLGSTALASENFELTRKEYQIIIEFQDQFNGIEYDSLTTKTVKFKRGKAIIFTVLTGLFGGHRIYFGTHHRTPILYSITFGGLGILPVIDLVHIIFTKDLSRYENKSQVIMWKK